MRNNYQKSDVRKEAIALKYDQDAQIAPKVIAKGKGVIANNILESAEENNIPIQQDPTLIELMSGLNINDAIPEELYKAVAEVFAFVYQLDKNYHQN